jgi:fructose-bisphosphate aldolase class II
MPFVNMRDLLIHAREHGYAVAALDVVSLDFLEGVIRAAENCCAPVIVSLAESHFEHYDFELLMASTVAACRRSSAPLAIHLDHGASLDSAVSGIRLGCNGVMVDGSALPLADNLALTKAVADMAHACGVAVEGELGYVPGVEGEDAEKHPGDVIYTTPAEASGFVKRTGVDCLAVSVGTVHGRLRERPRLDFRRLAAIAEAVDIPLVIHGGTGLSDEQMRRLIGLGVAKINYYTALSDVAARSILERSNARASCTNLTSGVRNAVRQEAERVIRLFGGSGRAAEVLAQCRPWHEVEHLILFNADGGEAAAMMEEGRRSLAAIPGVRHAATGRALTEGARYRYCWLIRFCSAPVIDAYPNHPDHLAFANIRFRPLAEDRLKIDYELD